MRRFRKTDCVDELYAFVTGEGILDVFKIIRMPREEVPNTAGTVTLEEAGLTSMESLHVELAAAPAAPPAPAVPAAASAAEASSSAALAPPPPPPPPPAAVAPSAPAPARSQLPRAAPRGGRAGLAGALGKAKAKRMLPDDGDDDVIDVTSPAVHAIKRAKAASPIIID